MSDKLAQLGALLTDLEDDPLIDKGVVDQAREEIMLDQVTDEDLEQ